MSQNTSIYWKNPETAERARWMAEAEDVSVSQLLSTMINERWEQLNPEPPITGHCSTCNRETEHVFYARWREQSDLYECSECGKVAQRDTIMNGMNDGHKMADDRKNGGNQDE